MPNGQINMSERADISAAAPQTESDDVCYYNSSGNTSRETKCIYIHSKIVSP